MVNIKYKSPLPPFIKGGDVVGRRK